MIDLQLCHLPGHTSRALGLHSGVGPVTRPGRGEGRPSRVGEERDGPFPLNRGPARRPPSRGLRVERKWGGSAPSAQCALMPPPFSSARSSGAPSPQPSPQEGRNRRGRARGERPRRADGLHREAATPSRATPAKSGPRAARETAAAGNAGASLPSAAVAAARKMAAPCGSERPANSPLKIPKMEVLSPASPGGLSDGNPSLSDPSTPRGASPLGPGSAAGSGTTASGGLGLGLGGRSAASSWGAPAAACRGMSWTPAETNALIAVWGNERLVEARYQQLEGAGTVFGSKAPGPAMYERVSRALAELGYERTPSQCRERIKKKICLLTIPA
ncbi:myb/SANT-like DNA-binding domain-containing protein 2 isoform X5 [Saccopteryx bilineata]|uniref:myb/SANT-like DNA-binding domain-containing protein 2 isoform X5 n=1 Tax=Saccopteryx bilineata TaxID=59482 RepID=UPI00338DB33B